MSDLDENIVEEEEDSASDVDSKHDSAAVEDAPEPPPEPEQTDKPPDQPATPQQSEVVTFARPCREGLRV